MKRSSGMDGRSFMLQEHYRVISYNIKKPFGQDRTATERNYVAEATRRRLRILLAGFFLIQIQCLNRRRRSEDRVHRFLPDHI